MYRKYLPLLSMLIWLCVSKIKKPLVVNCLLETTVDINRLYRLSIATLLVLGGIVLPATASEAPSKALQLYDILADTKNARYFLKGEQRDIRTGSLGFSTVDISLPGSGPTINITRTFGGDGGPLAFGSWDLDIPRVIVSINPNGTLRSNSGVCVDYVSKEFNRNGSSLPEGYYTELSLVIPGQGSKSLLRKESSDSRYPTNTSWVTTDHWTIECVSAKGDTNGAKNGFLVKAPNGTQYLMDELSTLTGDFKYGRSAGKKIAYVSQITAAGGSWVTYHYDRKAVITPGDSATEVSVRPYLTKITSGDGREVYIDYEEDAYEGFPLITRISTSADSAWSATREWLYKYDTGNREETHRSDYCSFMHATPNGEKYCNSLDYVSGLKTKHHSKYLTKVILPDQDDEPNNNLYWEFENKGPIMNSVYVHSGFVVDKVINHLTKVRLPTGAKLTYGYDISELNYGDFKGNFFDDTTIPRSTTWLARRSIEQNDGSTSDWRYSYSKPDSGQTVTTETNPLGEKTEYTYYRTGSKRGLLKSTAIFAKDDDVTPRRSEEMTYMVLSAVGTAVSRARSSLMTVAPRPLSRIVIDGQYVTTYSNFDTYGNAQAKTETTNGKSRTTTYSYKNQTNGVYLAGLLSSTVVAGDNGESWSESNEYNEKGLVIQTNQGGIKNTFTYDDWGNLTTSSYYQSSGTPITTTYSNYKFGTPESEVHPEGVRIGRGVNAIGRLSYEKTGEGDSTFYKYDNLGRVISVSVQGLQTKTFSYDQNTITESGSNPQYTKTISLDSLGRVILTKIDGSDAMPIYTRTTYDPLGRVTFLSQPSTKSTETMGISTSYDVLGRVENVTNTADNSVTKYCYGFSCYGGSIEANIDNIMTVTNAEKNVTVYKQEAFGDPGNSWNRIIEQPEGIKTEITRNKVGYITSVSQDGLTRSYSYYPNTHRLYTVTEPERGTVTYTYDDAGNVMTHSVAGMPKQTYAYDDLNRLKTIDYEDDTADVSYGYNRNGSLISMSNGVVMNVYNYTTFGALDYETLLVNEKSFSIDYGYDLNGTLNYLKYPDGLEINYVIDSIGRVNAIDDYASNIEYYPNGAISSLTYDNEAIVTYGQNSRQMLNHIQSYSDGDYQIKLGYDYDTVGNVTVITDELNGINTTTLDYDGVDRLTVANGSWGLGSFSYDGKGNLKSKNIGSLGSMTFQYDANNRLEYTTGTNEYQFNYDGFGNVLGNSKKRFTYNSAGDMTGVFSPEGDAPLISYFYDSSGIKVLEIKQDSALYSVYSQNGALLYEQDALDGKETSYIHLAGKTIAKVTTACDEVDSDGDGLTECVELRYGLDPENPSDAAADNDGDGLSNAQEIELETQLDNSDSDGDGIPDGWEVSHKLNPLVKDASDDPDGDGRTNYQEYVNDSGPFDPSNVPLIKKLIPAIYLILN